MAKSKGTKRGRKKKRVAAHIKDAAEKRAASAFSGNSGEDQRAQLLASPLGVGRPKRPREPAASVAKADDPGRKERERAEAINYLQAWMSVRKAKEEAEAGGVASSVAGLWKFSKNTQAWLLRHLFSEDQIDESSFGTLCLYLEGLKGSGRERVLAEAQAVIDKHGPDEGEEQTAAAREAAAAAPVAAEVETVDETVADEPAEVTPSGYNSDSSEEEEEEGEEGSGETAAAQDNIHKVAEGSPLEVATTAETGGGSDSGSSSDSDGDSSSSDSGGDSGEGAADDKEAVVEALTPAGKKQRKARSALTGDSKAEAKARTALVAYERALQLAELLS